MILRAIMRSVAMDYQGLAVVFDIVEGGEDLIEIFYSFNVICISEPEQLQECCFW